METLIFRTLFYSAGGLFLSHGFLRQSLLTPRYFLIHGFIVTGLLGLSVFFSRPLNFWLLLCLLSSALFAVFAGRMHSAAWVALVVGVTAFGISTYGDLNLVNLDHNPRLNFPILFLGNTTLSILLLGFTITSMFLGHWYLVQPTLPLGELLRLSYMLFFIVAVRFLFSSSLLLCLLWGQNEMEIYRYFLTSPGLFVLMRYVWGIVGPFVLCFLIIATVRIRSTQSATGILYVAVLCVLTGEILSQYLAHFHGIPL